MVVAQATRLATEAGLRHTCVLDIFGSNGYDSIEEGSVGSYLIYHPPRQVSTFGDITVYHDRNGGNQERWQAIRCQNPQLASPSHWVP